MNFVRLFTRRPVTTIMICGMMVMFGVYSYLKLSKDQFPKIDIPYVTITTIYPGAGPEEIESQVTKKIEEAVAAVSGLKSQQSISQENLSMVIAKFELSVNGDEAENDTRSKIEQILNDLPEDAEKPIVAQYDFNALPIAQIAVIAPRPVEEIYQVVDDKMIDRFTQIQGLAKVQVFGQKEREIVVSVSSKKLEAFGLSILDINNMVSYFNMKMPAGRVIEGEQEINIKLHGEFPSLDALKMLQIPTDNGVIRLADVATIEDTFEEVRNMAKMDGKTAVGLSLTKSGSANTLEIMHDVKKLIAKLQAEIPSDYQIVLANDKSQLIQDSINDVLSNLGIGILLTAGVLLLFLQNVRLTLIATVTLPVAVISTFSLMYASGYTANMMSLMAMALSVGVLVANAIVVLENIQRHLTELKLSPLDASEQGTSEIVIAVVGSALTNLAVFFPVAMMSSMVGRFFKEFGMTTVFATVISLFLAFTLTPMLSAKWLKPQAATKKSLFSWFTRGWDAMYGVCESAYRSTLRVALRFRWLTVFGIIVIFFGSFVCLKWIGGEFITKADQGQVSVKIEKAVDESLEGTSDTIFTMEERLKKLPYVKQFYTEIGGSEDSTTGVNEASITVKLVDRKQRQQNTNQIAAEFRRLFADIPGVKLTIQPLDTSPGSGDKPVQLNIIGPNIDDLFAVSEQAMAFMKAAPGAVDVDMNWRLGKPEVRVTPDYRRCADFGITPAQLAAILRASYTGNVGSVYRINGEEYDIRVKLSEEDRADASMVGSLPIQTPKGMTRLEALAHIETIEGPSRIYRSDRQRSVTIGANVAAGGNVTTLTQAVNAKLATIQLPDGVSVSWEGDAEMMQEAFIDMATALFLAVALTFMLLAILLESAVHALTIMSTIPLALIGVFGSLVLTGATLNIFSIMGIIMLVGIVVNNGLLIVDYVQELRRKGENWRDILLQASVVKLRPILMTNIAIMVSMIPMALGLGQDGEMRAPMAIVSIGGLFSSTFMTLYLVPVLYSLVESIREYFARRRVVTMKNVVDAPQSARLDIAPENG
ncbi:acriflavin resistance protein [Candidatus Moduliflexus flocculans]|uniref:Acriflavin resistance protein n=1 Tax=Candidatus Moduliflexus flocculans TaxID=1499966 RepID=A0A0S6VPD0_9BACT|nr:acriflavin resistance protein [Candidatus Moduliflexus flocculans]